MSVMKRLLDEILNCEICEGKGISGAWVSPDGDFDFEWCDCNPERLSPMEESYTNTMKDTCIGCNENAVSVTELYCYNCYLANNAEIDYTQIDLLWTTKENA